MGAKAYATAIESSPYFAILKLWGGGHRFPNARHWSEEEIRIDLELVEI